MEGGPFSTCSSRLSAAHTRLEHVQQLQGWRTVGFQNVALALAPRTLFIKTTDSRMEGGFFSKCSSRLSAVRIRLEHVQQFQGWRAVHSQIVALAIAPRTFVLKTRNSFKDGGRLLFKM